jgi:hypothetical protein
VSPTTLFLNKVQQAITYLQQGMTQEADECTVEAEQALKNVPHDSPGFDDLVILNTALRAYWNGTPSIDINELKETYHAAIEATHR